MPHRSLRQCPQPGCPNFTTGGRCDEHIRAAQNLYDARRGTAAARDYGARWQRLRKMVIARDPLCTWPDGCTEPSTDVDHIVSRARGGVDTMENLRGLCHRHHSIKTVQEDGGFGRRTA